MENTLNQLEAGFIMSWMVRKAELDVLYIVAIAWCAKSLKDIMFSVLAIHYALTQASSNTTPGF
jgi:hypothetical protein